MFNLPRKKGEVDSIHNSDRITANDDSINHGPENLSARFEVRFAEPRVDRCGEAIQASESLM